MTSEPTTLDDYLTKKAAELNDEDLEKIVKGFRDLRAQWNANQAAENRKLAKTTKLEVNKPKKGSATRVLKDLQL